MQALDRALSVLTAVARQEGVNLTDLSLSLGIPTATTHRILTTLQKRDFVRFDEERQDWTIGIEAYRTGVAYLKRTNLADAGRPVMRRLMEQTGETANLAVPDGAEVVFIGQVETQNPIRAFFPPGSRTPMHASGTGKAILAALPEDRLMALLKGAGLKGFTEETLITPRALFDDLAETRTRGWSFDRNERYDGMSCIGAAIFNDRGEPCAGVSISGPSSRFRDAQISEFGAAVAQAAVQITHLIAGKGVLISETTGSR
ncbi:IclR family transcriptional regulator [Roseovarius mucosus]